MAAADRGRELRASCGGGGSGGPATKERSGERTRPRCRADPARRCCSLPSARSSPPPPPPRRRSQRGLAGGWCRRANP
eukprot:scaffold1681_cov242-Prasinococcus_capsulatus_cf.AAC.9